MDLKLKSKSYKIKLFYLIFDWFDDSLGGYWLHSLSKLLKHAETAKTAETSKLCQLPSENDKSAIKLAIL